MIRPLPFVAADGRAAATLDPRVLVPGPTFFEQLDVPARVAAAGARSRTATYSSAAFAGATVDRRSSASRTPSRASPPRPGSPTSTGTRSTPPGIATGRRARSSPPPRWRALDALATCATRSLLVTADHGQIDVGADRPPRRRSGRRCSAPAPRARRAPRATASCTSTTPRPSSRELSARLGERAEVRLAAELFPDAGPRLRARLADVCVLPAPGRMAWLAAIPRTQLQFKGHHGGLTPEESETWIGA